MKQGKAKLRVCASCEWIFKGEEGCPKCEFGASYSARYVYGDKCYKYQYTQEPWLNREVAKYTGELLREIEMSVEPKPIKTLWLDKFKGGID